MNNPLVSVIIPTFNKKTLLVETIKSVINQTYENIEIIVVDDGSTDGTKEDLLSFSKEIRYFYKNNEGDAKARNFGLRKANGIYVAFLDHDDLWYSERIEKLTTFLENNKEYGAIISEVEFIDINGNILGRSEYQKAFPKDGYALSYTINNLLALFSNMFIRKEIVENIGGLDESLKTAADIDYYLRIGVNHKIALCEEVLLKYRKHDTSLSNELFTGDRLKVINKFIKMYPEVANKYKYAIEKKVAEIHLSYAEDLLWNRYIKEAKRQIRSSLNAKVTLGAIKLYIKCLISQSLSMVFEKYKDKGVFKNEQN